MIWKQTIHVYATNHSGALYVYYWVWSVCIGWWHVAVNIVQLWRWRNGPRFVSFNIILLFRFDFFFLLLLGYQNIVHVYVVIIYRIYSVRNTTYFPNMYFLIEYIWTQFFFCRRSHRYYFIWWRRICLIILHVLAIVLCFQKSNLILALASETSDVNVVSGELFVNAEYQALNMTLSFIRAMEIFFWYHIRHTRECYISDFDQSYMLITIHFSWW